ncbi:unnamed protein product [Vitrella brassicaformis CCMP3155]|uniref:Uncharacterized protein n=1 Tax=Vitrella brassicaformis (strain CCMP3155) TaxID=1169540 RepID=A0A0G4EDZ2_VITBC|nr:unnamed protein product [Vitrella brassicaformis CCMP3155]|eukprot:CEL93780.1 unnamed protein product [Vitrella brassicaformis CCMP3155]
MNVKRAVSAGARVSDACYFLCIIAGEVIACAFFVVLAKQLFLDAYFTFPSFLHALLSAPLLLLSSLSKNGLLIGGLGALKHLSHSAALAGFYTSFLQSLSYNTASQATAALYLTSAVLFALRYSDTRRPLLCLFIVCVSLIDTTGLTMATDSPPFREVQWVGSGWLVLSVVFLLLTTIHGLSGSRRKRVKGGSGNVTLSPPTGGSGNGGVKRGEEGDGGIMPIPFELGDVLWAVVFSLGCDEWRPWVAKSIWEYRMTGIALLGILGCSLALIADSLLAELITKRRFYSSSSSSPSPTPPSWMSLFQSGGPPLREEDQPLLFLLMGAMKLMAIALVDYLLLGGVGSRAAGGWPAFVTACMCAAALLVVAIGLDGPVLETSTYAPRYFEDALFLPHHPGGRMAAAGGASRQLLPFGGSTWSAGGNVNALSIAPRKLDLITYACVAVLLIFGAAGRLSIHCCPAIWSRDWSPPAPSLTSPPFRDNACLLEGDIRLLLAPQRPPDGDSAAATSNRTGSDADVDRRYSLFRSEEAMVAIVLGGGLEEGGWVLSHVPAPPRHQVYAYRRDEQAGSSALPYLGGEASRYGAWAKFVAEHYECLPEWVLLMQGHRYIGSKDLSVYVDDLSWLPSVSEGDAARLTVWSLTDKDAHAKHASASWLRNHHPEVLHASRYIFPSSEPLPSSLTWLPSPNLAVHRSQLRKRSQRFWKGLLHWLVATRIDDEWPLEAGVGEDGLSTKERVVEVTLPRILQTSVAEMGKAWGQARG